MRAWLRNPWGRPRWLALIKEPPMRIHARIAVGSPTVRLAAIVAASVILALAATGLVVGAASLMPSPNPSPPVVAPVDGLVAYDSGGDIWVSKYDGSGAHRLTSGPADDTSPQWSPSISGSRRIRTEPRKASRL